MVSSTFGTFLATLSLGFLCGIHFSVAFVEPFLGLSTLFLGRCGFDVGLDCGGWFWVLEFGGFVLFPFDCWHFA